MLTRPYPHAIDTLDRFDVLGVKVAIVTNKLEALALAVLDALDLTRRFACVIGGDTMGPGNGKPSRMPIDAMIARCGGGRAAFVGDSGFDVAAAHAAGIPAVACRFGFLMQPVEELGADAIIDGFDELIPALSSL